MESSFDDVGSFYNGLSGKSKDDFGQGSDRFITYMNVYKNTIANPDGCELVLVEDGEHQNRVEYGDILFTQSSETLEEVGLSSVWLHKASPFLNSFCFGFHFKEKGIINPRFIAYGLRTSYMREQIIREGQGATRYNLSSNRLKPIKLVYPSYQEQSKVASLMSCIEKRIEKQQELICTLKKYKRGLLTYAFEEMTLSDDADSTTYHFSEIAQRRKEKYSPDSGVEYPCIELEHIEQGTGRLLGSVSSTTQSSIKTVARSGDVLFGKLRPYLRKLAFAEQNIVCSSEIWAFVPSEYVIPKYLYYLVQTEHFLRVANISSGTKMPRAEWANIEKEPFDIPCILIQEKTVSILEAIDKKICTSSDSLRMLMNFREGLLQQLFI